MRNAEGKRLVKLIKEARKMAKEANSDIAREMIFREHLLDNGIIVPPCKVGDKVYCILGSFDEVMEGVVRQFIVAEGMFVDCVMRGYFSQVFHSNSIGKTVFFSEAEAKYALKNRRSVSLVNGHIEE